MNTKVIYERKFTPDPEREQLVEKMKENLVAPAEHREEKDSSFLEFLEKMANAPFVPIPQKIRKQQEFIEAAIEFSEIYECDVTITQQRDGIYATFLFDQCVAMMDVEKVITMADELDFGSRKGDHPLYMTLAYCTHERK